MMCYNIENIEINKKTNGITYS